MDRSDVKDMFIETIGGTSLEDYIVDNILIESLALLDQLTAHRGTNFLVDNPVLVTQVMQYYYDLVQRNTAAAKESLVSIMTLVTQINYDFIQVEQDASINYMGGASEND
jgi:hypothetical protein